MATTPLTSIGPVSCAARISHRVSAQKEMPEETKRLSPSQSTLRELFVKSGNICAFPECSHPIVNADGTYIANLCHIEAALPGGPRFNLDQTNEERSEATNLMLMCHRHHKETDDVEKFPVEKLREIKATHEAKFDRILDNIANDIYDISEIAIPKVPESIGETALTTFEYDAPEVILDEISCLSAALQKLSPITRKIFKIIVVRASLTDGKVRLIELDKVVSLNSQEFYEHVVLLGDQGLAYDDEDQNYFDRRVVLQPTPAKSHWPVALVCREYCTAQNIALESMLVDLDFSTIEN